MATTVPLSIVDCCRIGKDVMIQFSNGNEVLFHAQFLWDSREDDGNLEILDTGETPASFDPGSSSNG